MKRCVKCGELKSEEEFAWRWKNQGIRQKACRDCRKIENNQWYRRHGESHREKVRDRLAEHREAAREYVWNYLSTHSCVECGESDPRVLEFDHIRGRKKHHVATMVSQGYTIESIQKEITKCQVLCANCHRRKTADERGWFKWLE